MGWFGMQCKLHVCAVTNSVGDEGSGWNSGRRLASPEHLANTVLFLSSQETAKK